MPERITVSAGHSSVGTSSVEIILRCRRRWIFVARLGGGTVRIRPRALGDGQLVVHPRACEPRGRWGEDTVLRKCPPRSPHWSMILTGHDLRARARPQDLPRRWGILLRGQSPHDSRVIFCKRTVVAIDGDTIHLDRDPRDNFWTDTEPVAATLFPIITGDYVNDVTIESLCINGNRAHNENLNGNYGGGIFIQDCDRITIRDVTARDNNSDGVSWQVCDDVTVEGCRCINNTDLGLHAGSGSERSIVRGCTLTGNGQGFFFCWGVHDSIVEDSVIEDSRPSASPSVTAIPTT